MNPTAHTGIIYSNLLQKGLTLLTKGVDSVLVGFSHKEQEKQEMIQASLQKICPGSLSFSLRGNSASNAANASGSRSATK